MGWISELRHFFFPVRGGFGWGVSVPLSSLVIVEDGLYEIVFRCCSSQWGCTGRDGLDAG